jgi:hypothetical protein
MNRLLLFLSLLLATPPVAAATPDPVQGELEKYLSSPYYLIEFFVFERTDVMEFNTPETLALNRPRAFPAAMRTQRLDPDYRWDGPLDALTLACLTYPSLDYELLPESLEAGSEPAQAAPESDPRSRPVPTLQPILEPHPQLELMAAVAAFERDLATGSQRWLPAEDFVLTAQAQRVQRTGLGRLLFHGRWLQAVPPREQPDPILIQVGEQLQRDPSRWELEGTVGVTLGRYLHFRAELFFHAPALGFLPIAAPMTAAGHVEPDVIELPGTRYMLLSESRRMRSTETHYLDHPKLGLVVQIDPVTFPVALVEAFETFEELGE